MKRSTIVLALAAVLAAGCESDGIEGYRTPLAECRCETQEQRDRMFSEAEWCVEHTDFISSHCYSIAVRRNCCPTNKED